MADIRGIIGELKSAFGDSTMSDYDLYWVGKGRAYNDQIGVNTFGESLHYLLTGTIEGREDLSFNPYSDRDFNPNIQTSIRIADINTPGTTNQDVIESSKIQAIMDMRSSDTFHIASIQGDYYSSLAGGSTYNNNAGSKFFPLEPIDVGAKISGYSYDKVDIETQKSFLADPYVYMAGSVAWLNNAYPDSGYALKVLGSNAVDMYFTLASSSVGVQYQYMRNKQYTEANNLNLNPSFKLESDRVSREGRIEDSFNVESSSQGNVVKSSMTVTDIARAMNVDTKAVEGMKQGIYTVAPQIGYFGNALLASISVGLYEGFFNHNQQKAQDILTKTTYDLSVGTIIGEVSAKGVQALGLTGVPGQIGVLGIGSVLQELVEIGLGTDISFGYGGEFIGTSKYGVEAFTESRGFMGIDSFIDSMAFSLGLTDTYTVGMVSETGFDLGYQTFTSGDNFSAVARTDTFADTFDYSAAISNEGLFSDPSLSGYGRNALMDYQYGIQDEKNYGATYNYTDPDTGEKTTVTVSSVNGVVTTTVNGELQEPAADPYEDFYDPDSSDVTDIDYSEGSSTNSTSSSSSTNSTSTGGAPGGLGIGTEEISNDNDGFGMF